MTFGNINENPHELCITRRKIDINNAIESIHVKFPIKKISFPFFANFQFFLKTLTIDSSVIIP